VVAQPLGVLLRAILDLRPLTHGWLKGIVPPEVVKGLGTTTTRHSRSIVILGCNQIAFWEELKR
jgi:hypothetical protein